MVQFLNYVLALVVLVWVAQSSVLSPLRIVVRISDCVSVPPEVLTAAIEAAASVFRDIGVQSEWIYNDKRRRCALDPLPAETRSEFQVAIVGDFFSGSLAADKTVIATAVRERALVYVLYDRVITTIDTARRNAKLMPNESSITAQTLGYTIVHELGHLLLPIDKKHSSGGIMARFWSVVELTDRYRAEIRDLKFTSEEAELIRKRLRELPRQ